MAGSIEAWYYGLPYVTRFYLSVCFGSTLLSTLGLLNPQSLYLDFDLVWQRFQLWRLTTCFMFLGSFSFPFLMQLMILTNYSSRLEEDPFPGGGGPTADYAFMLFFGAAVLWVVAFFMGIPFLGTSLIFMIVYVWSRRNPTAPVAIWGTWGVFKGMILVSEGDVLCFYRRIPFRGAVPALGADRLHGFGRWQSDDGHLRRHCRPPLLLPAGSAARDQGMEPAADPRRIVRRHHFVTLNITADLIAMCFSAQYELVSVAAGRWGCRPDYWRPWSSWTRRDAAGWRLRLGHWTAARRGLRE
jgi:hypothetical protein